MLRRIMVLSAIVISGCSAAPNAPRVFPRAPEGVVKQAATGQVMAVVVEVEALKLNFRAGQPVEVTTTYTAIRGQSRQRREARFGFVAAENRILADTIMMNGRPIQDDAARAEVLDELEAVMKAPIAKEAPGVR